jgi:DNA-binding transcriptional MerR regulator
MITAATATMTVGELSRGTGVSIKALRDYTDWGLTYTRGRSGANYRLYDDEALQCVQAITELRGLGLTLAEIRWLAARYPDQNWQLIGPLLAQRPRAARARIEARIADLEQTRGALTRSRPPTVMPWPADPARRSGPATPRSANRVLDPFPGVSP